MKVKIFQFWGDIDDAAQDELSAWLKQNPSIDIKFVAQSESQSNDSSSVTVTVWYTDQR